MLKINSSSLRRLLVLFSAPPYTHRINHSSILLLYFNINSVSHFYFYFCVSPPDCEHPHHTHSDTFSSSSKVPGGHHVNTIAQIELPAGCSAVKATFNMSSNVRNHYLQVTMVDTIIYRTELLNFFNLEMLSCSGRIRSEESSDLMCTRIAKEI